jgi:hypothetical protein
MVNDNEGEEAEAEDCIGTDNVADTLAGPTDTTGLPGGETAITVVVVVVRLSLKVSDKLGAIVSTASVVQVTDPTKLEGVSSDMFEGKDETVGARIVLKPGNIVITSEELPILTVVSV